MRAGCYLKQETLPYFFYFDVELVWKGEQEANNLNGIHKAKALIV
jgi:hypothetical protein